MAYFSSVFHTQTVKCVVLILFVIFSGILFSSSNSNSSSRNINIKQIPSYAIIQTSDRVIIHDKDKDHDERGAHCEKKKPVVTLIPIVMHPSNGQLYIKWTAILNTTKRLFAYETFILYGPSPNDLLYKTQPQYFYTPMNSAMIDTTQFPNAGFIFIKIIAIVNGKLVDSWIIPIPLNTLYNNSSSIKTSSFQINKPFLLSQTSIDPSNPYERRQTVFPDTVIFT